MSKITVKRMIKEKGKDVEVVGEVEVDLNVKVMEADPEWLEVVVQTDIEIEMSRVLQGGVKGARRIAPAALQAHIDAYQVGSDSRALERRAKAILALPREDQDKLLDGASPLLVSLVRNASVKKAAAPKVKKVK